METCHILIRARAGGLCGPQTIQARLWSPASPPPSPNVRAATRNNLPVDRITEVSVLDPYCYR